ncbi:hypothetical protein D3C83_261750 [compost metagenome]
MRTREVRIQRDGLLQMPDGLGEARTIAVIEDRRGLQVQRIGFRIVRACVDQLLRLLARQRDL